MAQTKISKNVQVALTKQPALLTQFYPTINKQSKDDMFVVERQYALFRSIYETEPLLCKSDPTVEPVASTSTKDCAIRPAFKKHEFYPERRKGRGPKYVKTDLDQ